jgi:hypothetical protein
MRIMRTVKHVSLWTLQILVALVLAITALEVSQDQRLQARAAPASTRAIDLNR